MHFLMLKPLKNIWVKNSFNTKDPILIEVDYQNFDIIRCLWDLFHSVVNAF